jgi:hypothetical protein
VIQDSEKADEQTLESTPPIVETSAPVEEVPEESTESVDEDISEPEVIPAVEADQPCSKRT